MLVMVMVMVVIGIGIEIVVVATTMGLMPALLWLTVHFCCCVAFSVYILEGINLFPHDEDGFNDPYLKIKLGKTVIDDQKRCAYVVTSSLFTSSVFVALWSRRLCSGCLACAMGVGTSPRR